MNAAPTHPSPRYASKRGSGGAPISARLSEAGVQAISQRSIGGPEWGVSGARDVYVEEHDLVRAREVLKADEGVSEGELADLSDAAPAQLKDPNEGEPTR